MPAYWRIPLFYRDNGIRILHCKRLRRGTATITHFNQQWEYKAFRSPAANVISNKIMLIRQGWIVYRITTDYIL